MWKTAWGRGLCVLVVYCAFLNSDAPQWVSLLIALAVYFALECFVLIQKQKGG
jgi:hypothetical protein